MLNVSKGLNVGAVCDNHHEDFESDINCFDDEVPKSDDKMDELERNPSMTRDSLISNFTRFSESRDTQEAGKVEAPLTQHRKLPLWTRRTCPVFSSYGKKFKHISGNKREASPIYREDELVLKRQQYFQDEIEELFEVVEAGS